MSRHRLVRNMADEDMYDEEDDYEVGQQEELDEETQAQYDSACAEVQAILGSEAGVTEKEVRDTVWHYYFDVAKSVTWLLDQQAKKAQEAEKASKAKAAPAHVKKAEVVKKIYSTDAIPLIDAIEGLGLSDLSTLPKAEEKPAPVVAIARPKISPEEMLARIREDAGLKEELSIVIVGHVDAGKSTLMGHLLFLLGKIDPRVMQKYAREAEKVGKGSFSFAWVLDETEEERGRGITMDVGCHHFETSSRNFTILDAPGHRDFVPQMISGASQADAALLVVDATTGEFESGFLAGGQTKEHILLIRGLGVRQLVVAVNKMDTVGWSGGRFEEIRDELATFLTATGFRGKTVVFVPCSGLTGENLIKRSPEVQSIISTWYQGGTLVEELERLHVPKRLYEYPMRASITDVFRAGFTAGISAAVRVETGYVAQGDTVQVMPSGEGAQVKAIEVDGEEREYATAGGTVTLLLQNIDPIYLSTGYVLCDPGKPLVLSRRFEAQILVFDLRVPITVGVPAELFAHHATEVVRLSKLTALLDKATGEVKKRGPRCLTRGATALVELECEHPFALEVHSATSAYGRFTLRKAGETIAAGVVKRLL